MTTAREWIKILESFHPDEQIIATIYSSELFGEQALITPDGDEYEVCPQHIWDEVAEGYEFHDFVNEQIYEDIRLSLQDAIDAKGGE